MVSGCRAAPKGVAEEAAETSAEESAAEVEAAADEAAAANRDLSQLDEFPACIWSLAIY